MPIRNRHEKTKIKKPYEKTEIRKKSNTIPTKAIFMGDGRGGFSRIVQSETIAAFDPYLERIKGSAGSTTIFHSSFRQYDIKGFLFATREMKRFRWKEMRNDLDGKR
jgi:hypothetical protein